MLLMYYYIILANNARAQVKIQLQSAYYLHKVDIGKGV